MELGCVLGMNLSNATQRQMQVPGLAQQMLLVYTGCIIFGGLFANLACIWEVCRKGTKLRNNVSTRFLIGICASDMISIFAFFAMWISGVWGFNATSVPFICMLTTFCGFAGPAMCTYFIAEMTFTRFHAVKWPLKHRSHVTKNRVRIVILVTTIVCFTYYGWIMNATYVDRNGQCEIKDNFQVIMRTYDTLALVFVFAVPYCFIAGMNVWLAAIILSRIRTAPQPRRSKRHGYQRSLLGESRSRTISIQSDGGPNQSLRVHSCRNFQSSRVRTFRSARRLILVSLVYMTLNLPVYVMRCYCTIRNVSCTRPINLFFYNLLISQYLLNCFLYSSVLSSAGGLMRFFKSRGSPSVSVVTARSVSIVRPDRIFTNHNTVV